MFAFHLCLNFRFCGKHNGWELDIQFPTLKFAIEINGIWHYKPIRGEEKLIKIQNRDKIKAEVCKLTGIELFILPVLENVVYKPAFEKYWKIVYDKMIEKMSPVGIEPTT